MVDVADGSLFLLKVTTGSHEVEDWRNEVRMLRLAVERTRKGCKETPLAAFRYHQYPKHLAFLQFLVPLFMLIDIRLHFVRRRNT